MLKQKTLKDSFSLSGKGLHTGLDLTVTFNPAPENHGYKIQRVDLEGKPLIEAVADNVVETTRGTVLAKNDIKVSIPVNAIDWGHTLFEKGGAFYNVFTNWIDNASGRYSFTWDKPRERKERIKIANGVKEWLQKLADEGMASYPESHLTVMVQAMKSQACDIGIDLFDKNQLFATTFKQS